MAALENLDKNREKNFLPGNKLLLATIDVKYYHFFSADKYRVSLSGQTLDYINAVHVNVSEYEHKNGQIFSNGMCMPLSRGTARERHTLSQKGQWSQQQETGTK